MGFLLIILILFLLYMNNELFSNTNYNLKDNYKYYEYFSEESYPVGEGSYYFNPNSRSNDYFYDRTGMKGSVFIDISEEPVFDKEYKKPVILSQIDAVYKLGLYPEDIYINDC